MLIKSLNVAEKRQTDEEAFLCFVKVLYLMKNSIQLHVYLDYWVIVCGQIIWCPWLQWWWWKFQHFLLLQAVCALSSNVVIKCNHRLLSPSSSYFKMLDEHSNVSQNATVWQVRCLQVKEVATVTILTLNPFTSAGETKCLGHNKVHGALYSRWQHTGKPLIPLHPQSQ